MGNWAPVGGGARPVAVAGLPSAASPADKALAGKILKDAPYNGKKEEAKSWVGKAYNALSHGALPSAEDMRPFIDQARTIKDPGLREQTLGTLIGRLGTDGMLGDTTARLDTIATELTQHASTWSNPTTEFGREMKRALGAMEKKPAHPDFKPEELDPAFTDLGKMKNHDIARAAAWELTDGIHRKAGLHGPYSRRHAMNYFERSFLSK